MEFFLIASAHFMALLSPGPDFFLILQTSLQMPRRYALAVCCGIAMANGVYLLFAVTGLEIIKEMHGVMLILKYLGGAYLFYIGILLLKAPVRSINEQTSANFLRSRHLGRQFFVGFMSALLNPKNAVFYLSLFTVMVSPETPLEMRAVYGLWMTGVVLAWDVIIASVLSAEKVKQKLGRWIFFLEKAAGALLAFFGIMLTL